MTFIASVIAKEGIAVVADSFRTTIEQIIDEDSFIEYLKNNKKPNGNAKSQIPLKDLINLFEEKASHTRNYVDKLVQFDNDTAVASTGAAYINSKEVKDIIHSISATLTSDRAKYEALSIDEKISNIIIELKVEVVEHLKKHGIGATDFILSHYNRTKNEPQVFVIKINKREKDDIRDDADNHLIEYEDKSHLKIITDGQDTFVDRLIFGSLYTNMYKVRVGVNDYISKKIKTTKKKKEEIFADIFSPDFLRQMVVNDVFAVKFRELSLQEAVDLAALLIKIVMDIQIYTEKIPTVGGLIRLAVISKESGFKWISGSEITPPKII